MSKIQITTLRIVPFLLILLVGLNCLKNPFTPNREVSGSASFDESPSDTANVLFRTDILVGCDAAGDLEPACDDTLLRQNGVLLYDISQFSLRIIDSIPPGPLAPGRLIPQKIQITLFARECSQEPPMEDCDPWPDVNAPQGGKNLLAETALMRISLDRNDDSRRFEHYIDALCATYFAALGCDEAIDFSYDLSSFSSIVSRDGDQRFISQAIEFTLIEK